MMLNIRNIHYLEMLPLQIHTRDLKTVSNRAWCLKKKKVRKIVSFHPIPQQVKSL